MKSFLPVYFWTRDGKKNWLLILISFSCSQFGRFTFLFHFAIVTDTVSFYITFSALFNEAWNISLIWESLTKYFSTRTFEESFSTDFAFIFLFIWHFYSRATELVIDLLLTMRMHRCKWKDEHVRRHIAQGRVLNASERNKHIALVQIGTLCAIICYELTDFMTWSRYEIYEEDKHFLFFLWSLSVHPQVRYMATLYHKRRWNLAALLQPLLSRSTLATRRNHFMFKLLRF